MEGSYPAAPWSLRGWGAIALQPVDLSCARSSAPAELAVVPIFPRASLGGLYVASYETGSTLVYHELIVMSGLVRDGLRVGAWIPRIYVDDPFALAGGRAIWGLPKELARFSVSKTAGGRRVSVTQNGAVLCVMEIAARPPAVRLPLPLPGFGRDGRDPLFVVGRLASRLSRAAIRVQVPPESPLASFALDRPRLGFALEGLDLSVAVPHARRARAPVPSAAQFDVTGTSIVPSERKGTA